MALLIGPLNREVVSELIGQVLAIAMLGICPLSIVYRW